MTTGTPRSRLARNAPTGAFAVLLAVTAGCGGSESTVSAATTAPATTTTTVETSLANTTIATTAATTTTTTAEVETVVTSTTTDPVSILSVDELIDTIITLDDLPAGYVAMFPGPSETVEALDEAPCSASINTKDLTYALVNAFTWPHEELGWPAEGVVTAATHRVDVDSDAVANIEATRQALQAGSCETSVEDVGLGMRTLLDIESGPGIDAAVAHMFVPYDFPLGIYTVKFAASGHIVTLTFRAVSPDLSTVPQLAQPIVDAALQRIVAVVG